jgi:hypothetical protein
VLILGRVVSRMKVSASASTLVEGEVEATKARRGGDLQADFTRLVNVCREYVTEDNRLLTKIKLSKQGHDLNYVSPLSEHRKRDRSVANSIIVVI